MSHGSRAAEIAARGSYGRILAFLSARTHDIAAAEDALADAFAKALTDWQQKGVPDNSDAWLLTVARNRLTDRQRHTTKFPAQCEIPDLSSPDQYSSPLKDKRLELLMVCAHPAIAIDLHTSSMVAARDARNFLPL